MIRCRMVRGLAVGVALAALTASSPPSAAAPQDGTTTIRSGDHPGFGRVVIDTDAEAAFHLDQVGERVVVRFLSPIILGTAPSSPRNVVAIKISDQSVELTIRSGSTIRSGRIGGRVVIDVLNRGGASPAKQPPSERETATSKRATDPRPTPTLMTRSPELGGRIATPTIQTQPSAADLSPAPPAGAKGGTPVQAQPLAPHEPPASPDPPVLEVNRQPPPIREVLVATEQPIGLLARRIKLPKGMDGSAFLVPFSDSTGAAAFREGDTTYVVFDERRPIDMSALKGDPVFGQASVQTLPTGTLLGLPVPASVSIAVSQTPQGWRVAALPAAAKPQPIAAVYAAGRLSLPAEQAGEVVSMADPETGATLFVGTQRRPGQAVTGARRGTEFILRPTLQGVVIEPLSDAVVLKTTPSGFSLAKGSGELALSQATNAMDGLMDAANLTRQLQFSTLQPDALMRHLTAQIAEAAMTPPLARGPKRRAAAESMISLGLEAEAESLLRMATEQDPKEAASAATAALTAVAALLAGRPGPMD
jgi:hypothetical protein